MPYDPKDPRAALTKGGTNNAKPSGGFAGTEYAKFYEAEPDEIQKGVKTWYVRGQNFVLAYTEAAAGTELLRSEQPDEYVVLLPDRSMSVNIITDGIREKIDGYTLSFVPPGESGVEVLTDGSLIRLFTIRSSDLVSKCSNARSYESPHSHVALFESWPDPTDGYQLRSYSLDVPREEGRFGRIWRCSTFMVNFLYPYNGPRDATALSPHSHDNFEQCSLALAGEFMHYIRWPWTPNMNDWKDDEQELCGAPSVAVIPPPSIHTTRAVGKNFNQLVDIFCPPRMDFSKKPGWVLNSDEYPLP